MSEQNEIAEAKIPRRQKPSPNTLRKQWAANFAALSSAEQAEILAQQDELNRISFLHDDVQSGVPRGLVAGKTMCYPDIAYLETKAFLERFPLVKSWVSFADAHRAIRNDSWDDDNFRLYGKRTRVVCLFYFEFLRAALLWCDRNPSDCEPGVRNEIAAIVEAHKPDWQKELDRKSVIARTPTEDESFRKEINIGFEVQERELEEKQQRAWLRDVDNASRIGL